MNLKFSVLIANYNNATFIKEAIDSIISQSYSNWEIIIVDDASTDESIDVIQEYLNDKRIIFEVNSENKGCGFTKNKCTKLATGEILGFLDPDDKLANTALEVMVKEHINGPEYSLIFSNRFLCDSKLNLKKKQPKISYNQEVSLLDQSEGRVSHFATFKMDNYRQTKGIDESFKRAVDMDLYYKLEEVGKISFTDQRIYYWRIHNSGISTNTNFPKARAWGIYAKIKACQRRGIPFEDVISKNVMDSKIIENYYRNSREFKIGFFILKPYRKIRSLFK